MLSGCFYISCDSHSIPKISSFTKTHRTLRIHLVHRRPKVPWQCLSFIKVTFQTIIIYQFWSFVKVLAVVPFTVFERDTFGYWVVELLVAAFGPMPLWGVDPRGRGLRGPRGWPRGSTSANRLGDDDDVGRWARGLRAHRAAIHFLFCWEKYSELNWISVLKYCWYAYLC